MPDNIYVFSGQTVSRNIKIWVYADSMETAIARRDRLLDLYINHAARSAIAAIESGLQSDDSEQRARETRIREVAIVKAESDIEYHEAREVMTQSGETCRGAEDFGSPWTGIRISDRNTGDFKDEFNLPYTAFTTYPDTVSQEEQKFSGANDPVNVATVNTYLYEFYRLNSRSRLDHDVIKLLGDQKRLHTQYIEDKVDLNLLDGEYRERVYEISRFINRCRQENSRLREWTRITPLMKLMGDDSNSLYNEDALNKFEASATQLLKGGADVNATDSHGRTALMYVVLGIDLFENILTKCTYIDKIAQFLLDKGADPNIQDKQGNTALDYFRQYTSPDHPSIKLLEDAMQPNAEPGRHGFFR